MLKKYLSLLLATTAFICSTAFAKEKAVIVPENPTDWSISMMDSYKSKENHPNWSIIEENQFGIFAYDLNSMQFLVHKKVKDTNVVEATVKTVFSNKEMLKKLNQQFSEKLAPREKVSYWVMHMRFDLSGNMYTIKKTEYFSNKGTLLETVVKKGEMKEIPEESFAAKMYQICREWAEENKEAL